MTTRLPWPGPAERKTVAWLRRHQAMDYAFYRAAMPCWQQWLSWRPEWHYLLFGAKRKRDPHPGFSTRWYLEHYPDVARGQLNPLVHFMRFGVHEGRLPSADGVISDFPGLKALPVWHYHQAWHGHAAVGLSALERLMEEGSPDAAWYLASWHYGQGQYALARHYLQRSQALGEGHFAAQVPQALAKCLLHLEEAAGVKAVDEARHFAPGSSTAALLQLGRSDLPAAARLEGINAWLQHYRLAPLRLCKEAGSLSLATLCTPRVRANDRHLPWVTAVVPAYNASATIGTAVKSLLAQSWPRLEILVVDDASEDDTAEKVTELARLAPRVRLIRHEHNRGAYAARNTGMQAARGDYLTVHDSDDWSHPERITRQLHELRRHPEAKASMTSWLRVDARLRPLGPWHLCPNWLEPNPSSLLVTREVVETLGFWDEVRVAADNEFIERIRCHYGQAGVLEVLPEVPLAFSLVQPDSLTRRSATHVRTVHNGVRHLYHQAARWWHRRHVVPVMPDHDSRRPFPIPLGNSAHGDADLAFDVAVLGDASPRNPALDELLAMLLEVRQTGQRVVFCPWSRADDFASRQVADDVWELCHEEKIAVAHSDVTLRCPQVRAQHLGDPVSWPDRSVTITGVTNVVTLERMALPAELTEALVTRLASAGNEAR